MSACPECGSGLPVQAATGRPRVYCGLQCRRTAEHRISRARRLVERLESRLIDLRLAVAGYGDTSVPGGLLRQEGVLEIEIAKAEGRLRELLAVRSQDVAPA
jgi:hypothetical protein